MYIGHASLPVDAATLYPRRAHCSAKCTLARSMDVVEALRYHFIRGLFFASRQLWRHRFTLAEIQLTAIVTVAIAPAEARRLQ